MAIKEGDDLDAAAFVYIRSCLMGCAHRFRKKRLKQMQTEPATLNEPVRQDESSVDRLGLVAAFDPYCDPNRITDLVSLQAAMKCLTPNELKIIKALFFDGERVIHLCASLNVSKNTVLKTKRNALKKLRAGLQQSHQTDREGRS